MLIFEITHLKVFLKKLFSAMNMNMKKYGSDQNLNKNRIESSYSEGLARLRYHGRIHRPQKRAGSPL